jgi:hypothetical protein
MFHPVVTAHSNWCELTLQSMGHREVFAHVGRNVTVHAPNGQNVPILVTGTFGGSDFIHSLLGKSAFGFHPAAPRRLTECPPCRFVHQVKPEIT